jgi:uncharacterized membrane protein
VTEGAGTLQAPPSTTATRWFLPLAVIWAGLLLSAWVFTKKIPEEVRTDNTERLVVTLLAVPLVSTLVLVVLRAIGKKKQAASRAGDMLVVWIMAFLFVVHASVLAVAIGMIESLDRTVPAATGVLMVGLGLVLFGLEPGSAMGIRTKATLGSEAVWRRTHQLAAKLFAAAGIVALGGLLVEGAAVVAVAVLPGALALVISIAYASKIEPEDESEPEPERPKHDEDGSP